MKTVEIHELTDRINELIQMLRENGQSVDLTDQGKVIAHIVPVSESVHPENDEKEVEAFLKAMHEIAEEIGSEVHEKVDVTEIISEGRRELPVSYEDNEAWLNLKRLSIEIGKHWTDGIDAVEAVQDVRRDL